MLRRSVAIGVAACTLLAGCGGAAAPAAPAASAAHPVTFNVGYPALGASFMPFYAGVATGIYKQNGLNVKLKLLAGSSSETQALVSGSVKAVISEANSALAAMGKGVPVVFVGSDLNDYGMQLWARNSIHSVQQLAGKRLGLEHVGSLTDSAAHQFFPTVGMSLKQMKVDYLGAPPTQIAAAIAGKVDAAIAPPPQVFELEGHGFHEIYDLGQLPHVSNGILMSKAFIKAHPHQVAAFLKANYESVAFIKNPANKTKVLAIMRQFTHVKNTGLLEQTYSYLLPQWHRLPTIPAADWAASIKAVEAQDHVKVSVAQAVDLKPLQQLEESGALKTATP